MMYTLVLLFTIHAVTYNHDNDFGGGTTNINGYASQTACEAAAQHLQESLNRQKYPGKMYYDCIPQHTDDLD